MALEDIPQVYETDAAAKPHTTPEYHIFTLPSLPPVKDEHENIVKSIISVTITSIVTVTAIFIFVCIWKR